MAEPTPRAPEMAKRIRECTDSEGGRWEAILDNEGDMGRIRWSEPNAKGERLYVRHYPASPWGVHAAKREAEQFNRERRQPHEWRL